MTVPATTRAALSAEVQSESAAFLTCFDALLDPRQSGKVIYPLNEVLLLSLLATLAGAETFVEIALLGIKKRELLRRFLPFCQRHTLARASGRFVCDSGCRMLPALLCRLSGVVHRVIRRRDRH